jgi:hypothetical protein
VSVVGNWKADLVSVVDKEGQRSLIEVKHNRLNAIHTPYY